MLRIISTKLGFIFGGVCVGLLLTEIGSRLFLPSAFHADFLLQYPTTQPQYEIDEELGYRPKFFGELLYTDLGFTFKTSLIFPDAEKKILFIGDSVVRRGRIQRALSESYSGKKWDYLNGAVEGYDVVQEVGYFFRYLKDLKVQRIVLEFHNNDLLYFPMAYLTSTRSAFWYVPGEKTFPISLDLFRISDLYRHWCAWNYFKLLNTAKKKNSLVPDTKVALQKLKSWAEERNIPLQVFVFPVLRPYNQWQEEEKESRKQSLQMLRKLNIQHYDLLESLGPALKKGTPLTEDNQEDYWHPNDEAAKIFATYLKSKGIFDRW